jgi:hypothetical protein
MRHLKLPLLPHLQPDSPLDQISLELDNLPLQRIDNTPWPTGNEKPEVHFSIAHNRDCIFLKYYVTERSVQARYRKSNDPVYKDSCVEFFIAFQGEQEYYNLEFNCLGTCRMGFGSDRDNRKLLPTKLISNIKRFATLRAGSGKPFLKTWHLTLAIPIAVFSEHTLTNLEEKQVRANFYKCGDELPDPHFLTWNTMQAPAPDFHLPEFFGSMLFLSTPYPKKENHSSLQYSKA